MSIDESIKRLIAPAIVARNGVIINVKGFAEEYYVFSETP